VAACVEQAEQNKEATAQRDHIAQLCKQTGKSPEELGLVMPKEALPAIPPEGEYLWAWFWELDKGRMSTGFGVQALGWTDMQAWAQLTNTALMPWQTLALRQMDAAYLRAYTQASQQKEKEHGRE
jgi:hypothetical protein